MDKDVAVRLNYSSKYASVANYWKYFIGQTEQLKKNKVADKKRKIEDEFRKFAAGKPEYNGVLEKIQKAYDATNSIINIKVYRSEFVSQVDLNSLVYLYKLANDANAAKNEARQKQLMATIASRAEELYTKRSMDIEMETLEEVLKMYVRDIPAAQRVGLAQILTENSVSAFIERVKKYSVFTSKEKHDAFVASFSFEKLEQDPLFVLIKDLDNAYNQAMSDKKIAVANENLTLATRAFVKGIREMQPNKKFYPNANSTMRLTYGNVLPYKGGDAISYDYVTTFKGVLQKENPSIPEFNVDPIMKDTYLKGNLGQYADKNGELIVNFLSNNDITGGNSGSPVINGKGELIGTAFDGNWEAMSGDIFFEPNIQRTINLDIRYTLWIVDKVYGATNLINEMKIVK